jgi:HlyD family secretion protein
MKPPRLLARRLGLGLLLLALSGALVLALLRSGPMAPVRVTVHKVEQASLSPALFGIGTVEARRSYMIGPTSAGRVLRLAVDVGDRVKAGQQLAEMDPVDLDERLAALDAAIARAASAVDSARAQGEDAQARQQLAAANARRYADLGQKDFISAGMVEGKLQELSSAEALVRGAQANLAAANADLKRLTAERAGLRQQRGNVRLLAPADSVVVSREAEPGSTVVAGQAVLRLIEPDSLWLRARFDQGRSIGLATGLPAQIVRRSNPHRAASGKVARIEALGDSVTEERIAMIAFEPLPAGLSIGELAEVTLTLPAAPPALLVPNASVRREGERSGVWRIKDGTLSFVPVRLGLASLDGKVQVLDGLQAADLIVEFSEKELKPGSRIKIVDSLVAAQP